MGLTQAGCGGRTACDDALTVPITSWRVALSALPGRPRQHVLETESERALDQVLPAEWTVSGVTHDYGLDRRVEIFDKGLATGLGFLVQLKGTDADLPAALAETFKVTAINYMRAQAEPVFVVRYHAPTGRLFGFWMHRRDVNLKQGDQKSATLRWTEGDEVRRNSSSLLQSEVQRVRTLRAAVDEGKPLRVDLSDDDRSTNLRLAVSRRLAVVGRPLWLVSPGEPAEIRLVAAGDRLSADLAISSSSADVTAGTANSKAADLLLLAAISLGKIGRSSLSAALMRQSWDSSLLTATEVAATVANTFTVARAWTTGGSFLSHPVLLHDHGYAVILTAGFHADESVTDGEAVHFAGDMLARSEALEAEGELAFAAGCAYTAGNLYSHRAHVWKSAERTYERALHLDASYASRAYFCHELAAAKFESGHYAGSVEWYSRSLELEPTRIEAVACRADALAFSGQYAAANAEFGEYFRRQLDETSIWALKGLALQAVLTVSGAAEQDRAGDALVRPVDEASFGSNLQRDALHFESWRWLLDDALERNDVTGLSDPLLVIVAFCAERMTHEWIFLAAVALDSGDMRLFDQVIKSQWARRSEALIEDIVDAEGALPDHFVEEFDRVVQEVRRSPREFTVRHLEDGSLQDSMTIDLRYRGTDG